MGDIIGINALSYFLQRITTFIESGKKTLLFPNISAELEEVLLKLVGDVDASFLQSDQFSDKVKMEAAKLTAAIESRMNVNLAHEFQDGKHGPKVLMFKKIEVNTIKEAAPLRRPNEVQIQTKDSKVRLGDALVTSVFKSGCLNVTTKFVKDDKQLVMNYPKMSVSQAEFVMSMLLQGKDGKTEQMESKFGYRSMYAPLWEAMRMFGLKYDYKIDCTAEGFGRSDMKCIVFEKIPKFKEPEKIDVDIPEDLNTSISAAVSITSSSSATPTSNSVTSTPKKQKKSKPDFKVTVKPNKSQRLITNIMRDMGNEDLTDGFIQNTLRVIANYLSTDVDESIVFEEVNVWQEYFINNVKRLSTNDNSYMLFNSACQRHLGNIKYRLANEMKYKVTVVKTSKKGVLKHIKIEKLHAGAKTENVAQEKKEKAKIPPLSRVSNTPLTKQQHKCLTHYKKIKDRVKDVYIHKTLQEVSNFLSKDNTKKSITFNEATLSQEEFIKNIHIWSKNNEVYEMFSSTDQKLLEDIKLKAEHYNLRVVSREVQGFYTDEIVSDVTIVKKLATPVTKQHKTTRARSLSTGRRERCATQQAIGGTSARGTSSQRPQSIKEKLMEGLNQPVQSDKAMRIMQSMGWKGGALGLRGTGITEPIMPSLDLANRAGLGHVKPPPKRFKPKQLQPNPGTKPTQLNLPPSDLFPQGILPLSALQPSLIPNEILPSVTPVTGPEFKIKLEGDYRLRIFEGILRLVTSNIGSLRFFYLSAKPKPTKVAGFLREAVTFCNRRLPWVIKDKNLSDLLAKIQAVFTSCYQLRLTFEIQNECAVVQKWALSPNNNNRTENNKTTTAQQNNKNPTQITDYIDLTGEYVVQVAKDNDGTSSIQNVYSKTGVPVKHSAYWNNDLTRDEPQIMEAIAADNNIQADNNALKDRNNQSSNSKKNVKSHRNVQSGIINVKLAQNDVQIQSSNNSFDKKVIKNDDIVQNNNEKGNKSQIRSSNNNVKNGQFVQSDKKIGNLSLKVVDKQLNINNPLNYVAKNYQDIKSEQSVINNPVHNDAENDQGIKNDKGTANTDHYDIKKHSINNIFDWNDAEKAQTVKSSSGNGNLDQKYADKQSSIENPVKNDQAVQNYKETVTTQNDIKKHSSYNKSDRNDAKMDHNIENDKITVSYITVVECKATIVPENSETKTDQSTQNTKDNAINSTNSNDNPSNKTNNTQTDDKQDEITDYEDDDCEIIIDTSETIIEISSEEENILLYSDEETKTDKPANRVAMDKTIRIKQENPHKFDNAVKANDFSEVESVKIENDQYDSDEKTVILEKDESGTPHIQERKLVKRPSLDSPDEDQTGKKCKLLADFKKLCILRKDYPQVRMNREKAREIQTSILTAIDYTKSLPLLKCQGIQNGGLVYSCQDEETLFFVEDLINAMDDLRIVYEFDVKEKVSHKMAFRINSFLEEDVDKILERLELFNWGLAATKWEIIKKEQYNDFIVIHVELDDCSFKYICDAKFNLYVGNDCAKFSIVWD